MFLPVRLTKSSASRRSFRFGFGNRTVDAISLKMNSMIPMQMIDAFRFLLSELIQRHRHINHLFHSSRKIIEMLEYSLIIRH